jgi:NAD(P) transhydrogenase subunit alpha
MRIGVPKEPWPGETRAPLVPDDVQRLRALGAEVEVERGLGDAAGYPEDAYRQAGACVSSDRAELLARAGIVIRLRPPPQDDLASLRPGSLQIGFLDTLQYPGLLDQLAQRGTSVLAMERIPRLTRAQPMDALTSQANLAGYVAVLLAAVHLKRIMPLMMTAAGTLSPARVFVLGTGVAGLQAIATARRLGARVVAHDIRPVTRTEVQSLGATFLSFNPEPPNGGDPALPAAPDPDAARRQREGLCRACANADALITTAQSPGRRAPVLVSDDMIAAMRPGSVIVDAAADSGGNVEGIEPDTAAERHGVVLLAWRHLANRVPFHASQVYSANVTNLIEAFWNRDQQRFELRREDDVLRPCLVVREGLRLYDT